MKTPQHTEKLAERVVCAKPGRVLLLKLCTVVMCLVGAAAVGAVIWAEVTGFNLNKAPMVPRLALAVAAIAACWGLFQSIEEKAVTLQLDFYPDRLELIYPALPGLWREGIARQQTVVPYRSVTSCLLSHRRCRLTLRSTGYTRTLGEGQPQHRQGAVSFSTLELRDTDLPALFRRYAGWETVEKD